MLEAQSVNKIPFVDFVPICKVLCFFQEKNESLRAMLSRYLLYLFLFACIIIARTFKGKPNRLINPSASLWLYNSPVVKLAIDSLYRE